VTKLNGTCNRCKGTGFRSTPVLHLGIPGLCYGCDGDGTYDTFAAKRVAEREAKKRNDAFSDAYNMVEVVKSANGGQITLGREKRLILRQLGVGRKVFRTKDYAEAVGITEREAWVELCRTSRGHVCPNLGDDLKPNGWVTEM
jgi:hypothetical protein